MISSAVLNGCVNLNDGPKYGDQRTIEAIRRINAAETEYFAKYHRFVRLEDLGQVHDSVSPDRTGSVIVVEPGSESYYVVCDRSERGRTGWRSFYSDQTQVIRQNWGDGLAHRESPPL